jgi:Ca-activated chloride channel family protein
MQRHVVVYGLAVSTLAGAFLLAPRLASPPPPPVEHPLPPSTAPVARLVYGDGVLEVVATLDRAFVKPGSVEPVWLDVAVKAAGVQQRAPLAAVLVVDRSGSMAGDKIDAARAAAERFVHGMADGDLLAIVTYGSDVTVDLALTALTSSTRQQALDIVRRIEEGGGTNIDGGLQAARVQLQQGSLGGRVARVVLVSDGRPTEGDRSTATLTGHAQQLRSLGAATSTLGLGLDYNEDLMEALAVDGGGRYHYLRSGEQLTRILDDELQHGRNVVAAGVTLHLPRALAPGLRIAAVPGQKDIGNADKLVVDIGDLAAGEERHVLVKFDVVHAADNGFAAPELVYRKPGATTASLVAHRADAFRMKTTDDVAALNASRVDDVRVRVLQVEASLALTASMSAWSAGDATAARDGLQKAKADLAAAAARTGNAVLLREADNVERVLRSVASAPAPASEAGMDIVKAQKARAFELRR